MCLALCNKKKHGSHTGHDLHNLTLTLFCFFISYSISSPSLFHSDFLIIMEIILKKDITCIRGWILFSPLLKFTFSVEIH